MTIEVTSPVFSRIRRIPKTNVCPGRPPKPGTSFEQDALTRYADRKNTSPPLDWTGIPEGTQSIAVLMDSDQIAHAEDPDARFTHWIIWNLPADASGLPESVATTTDVAALGPDVRQGTNDDKHERRQGHRILGPVPAAGYRRLRRGQAQGGLRVPVPRLCAGHGTRPGGRRDEGRAAPGHRRPHPRRRGHQGRVRRKQTAPGVLVQVNAEGAPTAPIHTRRL